MKQSHGGKRENSGRKPGKTKESKTFSIDHEIIENKPSSKLVNQLLCQYYKSKKS